MCVRLRLRTLERLNGASLSRFHTRARCVCVFTVGNRWKSLNRECRNSGQEKVISEPDCQHVRNTSRETHTHTHTHTLTHTHTHTHTLTHSHTRLWGGAPDQSSFLALQHYCQDSSVRVFACSSCLRLTWSVWVSDDDGEGCTDRSI